MAAVQDPSPLGVGTPSSFNARAIPRSDAVRSGSTRSIIGAVTARTALTNQLRAILLERGLIFPKGRKTLMRRLDQQPAELNELGTRMQQLVADIRAESAELDKRIEALNDDWPKSPVGTNLPGDWRRSQE